MSKYLKYGIIEDIDTVRRIPIGRFWGIRLLVTPITWLSPFVFFGLHFLVNLLNSNLSLTDRLYQSLLFTIAVEITTVLHALGHIISGKMVNSAMDELLITATRDVNLYHGDQSVIPGHVHLIRSLGWAGLQPHGRRIVVRVCPKRRLRLLVGAGCQFDLHQPLLWLRRFPAAALCGW